MLGRVAFLGKVTEKAPRRCPLGEDMKEVKEWASSHGEGEHSRQREQSVQRPWDGPGVCAEQPGLGAALVSAGREQKDMEADSEAPAGVVRNLELGFHSE